MNQPFNNSFTEASKIETEALKDIIPFVQQQAYDGRFVITAKGNLSKMLQKTAGDIIMNSNCSTVFGIEIKAEAENKHSNFFIETWSNRSRWTLGWIFTLQTDILIYYFVKEKNLYSINFNRLKEWCFIKVNKRGTQGRLWDFHEKKQGKYNQLNDTWGRCVPVDVIQKELGYNFYNLAKQT